MAELAGKNGTYVRLTVNVWWDKGTKRVHVTSNDPDLPPNGLHMSAKPGTMSDANLREMLDGFGCGPTTKGVESPSELNDFLAYIDKLNPAGLEQLKHRIEQELVVRKVDG